MSTYSVVHINVMLSYLAMPFVYFNAISSF